MAPKWVETATDWQSKCSGVRERGEHLLRSGQFSDCSFLVGPELEHFIAHRLTLASASPIFEAMLIFSEKNEPIIIPDLQANTFKVLLEYIYTDKLDIDSTDLANDLCYGAQKYLMPQLFQQCVTYLSKSIAPENACSTYEIAQLIEDDVLAEKALAIVKAKSLEVLNHESFQNLQVDTVVKVFTLETLNINSELDLLEAAKRYTNSQGNRSVKERRKGTTKYTIRDAIKQIRFLTVDSVAFAVTEFEGLLTDSEALAISFNIACSDTHKPMPIDFSTSRIPRIRSKSGIEKNSEVAVLCIVVNNISKLPNSCTVSDKFNVCNMPFYYTAIFLKLNPYYWVYYLNIDYFNRSTWSCNIDLKCRILSNSVNVAPVYLKINRKFEDYYERSCLFQSNINDTILDPDNGYIMDDTITMEVIIKTINSES